MAKQRFKGKLYKVPKTALFTKEVKVSQKGVAISKARIEAVNPLTGEIEMVRIKINDNEYVTKVRTAELLRKEALATASKVNKKVKSGELTKYQAKGEIKSKLTGQYGVYEMAKRDIFIDNLLKRSGISMTESLTKYIQGRPDLVNKLQKVTKSLKNMSKSEFDTFYSIYQADIKDFTDYYKKIRESAEATKYIEALESNLDRLLENIGEFKSFKR